MKNYNKCEFCGEKIYNRMLSKHLRDFHNKSVDDNSIKRLSGFDSLEQFNNNTPLCKNCGINKLLFKNNGGDPYITKFCSKACCTTYRNLKASKENKNPFQLHNRTWTFKRLKNEEGKDIQSLKSYETRIKNGNYNFGSKAEDEVIEYMKSNLDSGLIAPYFIGHFYHPYDMYSPIYNIIFEYDGDYWHNKPESIIRDKKVDAYAAKVGIKLIRIKYSEHKKIGMGLIDEIIFMIKK